MPLLDPANRLIRGDARPKFIVEDQAGHYLPSPPTDDQRDSYFVRHGGMLMAFTIASYLGVAASMILLMRSTPELRFCLIYLVVLTLAFLFSLRVNLFTHDLSLERHRSRVDGWRPLHWPSVDVWLPTCGESLAVLQNSWIGVAALEWPGELNVHVADDSANPVVAELAASFGFACSSRENRGWMKKAGNLQHLFSNSAAEFCLILDADFTPRSDFLMELMPYFDDPAIGIVQSPQYFEASGGQGWLERGAGYVQEYFYRMIQTSRGQHESAICVGTNAIYRRTALDSNGGTTLISHSEDVHTGFDLRLNGWGLRYVPTALAGGLCPGDKAAFFAQQYRWCTGSMSLMLSRKFWSAPLSMASRSGYCSGFAYYISTAVTVVIAPLIPLLLVLFYPELVRLNNYVLLLPFLVFQFVVFPLWHRQRPRIGSWTVQLMYSWAHLIALLDFARGRSAEWQPSGGARSSNGGARALNWLMIVWSGGTTALLFACAVLRATDRPADFVPMILLSGFLLLVVARAFVPERGR